MNVARYRRARSVFDQVADLPRGERAAAVLAACGSDPALQALVEDLLRLDAGEAEDDGRVAAIVASAQAEGVAATTPVPLQPGVGVDRFTVLRLLGVGGTAQVWEVRHRTLGTVHALKVLTWADPGLQRRLLREARAQARLVHENLVPVTDIIEVNGAPGLLMPLIDGPALDELLAVERPHLDEALALMRAVVAGVAHAHARGFTHRDLKPGNVLLDLRGDRLTPRVADFGLVKNTRDRTLTQQGAVLGTLSYAAPEQLVDTSTADHRADLWSLGVMLVELTAGHRPFQAGGLAEMVDQHAAGPDLTGVPEQLQDLARALLAIDPAARPATCDALLDALPAGGPLGGRTPFGQAAQALADERASSRATVRAPEPEPWLPSEETDPPETLAPAPPPTPRSAWRGAAALAALVGLGAVVWDAREAIAPGPPAAATAATIPTSAPASRRSVAAERLLSSEPQAATEPDPARPPDSARPPDPAPDPAPDPGATAQAAPVAVAPEAAAPLPIEPTTPAPDPAQVVVSGETTMARLVSSEGSVHPPGPVPPGRYTFEARLSDRDNLVVLELGQLRAGQQLAITCRDAFAMCTLDAP